jgi:hypothetical protein
MTKSEVHLCDPWCHWRRDYDEHEARRAKRRRGVMKRLARARHHHAVELLR